MCGRQPLFVVADSEGEAGNLRPPRAGLQVLVGAEAEPGQPDPG